MFKCHVHTIYSDSTVNILITKVKDLDTPEQLCCKKTSNDKALKLTLGPRKLKALIKHASNTWSRSSDLKYQVNGQHFDVYLTKIKFRFSRTKICHFLIVWSFFDLDEPKDGTFSKMDKISRKISNWQRIIPKEANNSKLFANVKFLKKKRNLTWRKYWQHLQTTTLFSISYKKNLEHFKKYNNGL